MPQFNDYPLITDPVATDLLLIFQDSSGAVKTVTVDNLADQVGDIIGSAIGAPTVAKYILNTPNAELSSAQSLSELASGLLKSTTVTGILSIAAAGTDYVVPGVITSSGLTSITGTVLGRNTAGTGAIESLTTLPSAVQLLITQLGTVTTGVWNATPIDITLYTTGDIPVSRLDGGNNASAATFWRGDGTWAAASGGGGGSGDVVGPASAVNNSVAIYNSITGKLIKAGSGIFDDGTNVFITARRLLLSQSQTGDTQNSPLTLDQSGAYIKFGYGDYRPSHFEFMAFGYQQNDTYAPAIFGYRQTDVGGNTMGELVFGARNSGSGSVDTGVQMRFTSTQLLVDHTTTSTSASTGSGVFAGGLGVAENINAGGYVKTGTPSGGTAAEWKFGSLVTAAVVADSTRYIQLDVDGTLYKLIIST